ncbi:MAG: serine/threonine protein kinase [Bacteroidales bacterium]|nr:serine/threonine protein kinase [Bacteroidales bacterium]
MINQQVLNYTIVREIGRGGMATLYEAVHTTFENRKVAIKVLDGVFSQNKDIVSRFENEAKIMASLEHPNIVKVIDFEKKEGRLSIILELLDGKDFKDVIKENNLSKDQNLSLFKQVLEAINYGHSKNIVHRDIKPSNVFLTDNFKTAKVLDFGIAKLLDSDNQMTQTGFQMGTPVFMSPEQVKGKKDIDFRTDIYSLGVLLYYIFSGKPPYDANTSQFDILTKIVNEPLPPLTQYPNINQLITKATQKNPDHRFQNCTEFIDTINGLNEMSGFIEIAPEFKEEKPEIKKVEKVEEENIVEKKIIPPTPPIIEEKIETKKEKTEPKNKNIKQTNVKPERKKKKKKALIPIILLLLIALFFLFYKFSGFFSPKTWETHFGGSKNEEAYCIVADNNGLFVVGLTKSMNESMDWIVMKTDENGKEKWTYNFDGYDKGDAAHSIIPTDKTNYLIVGGIYKNDDLQAQSRVMKIDKNCDIIWDKEFGYEGWDEAVDVTEADNGSYIFVYTDNTGENTRIGIYKIANNGKLIWEKSVGDYGDFTPRSILQINYDEYIITGKIVYSEKYEQACLIKINNDGKILAENNIGSKNKVCDAEDVFKIDHDSFVITGYKGDDTDNKELWLAIIDRDLEIIDETTYVGYGSTVGLDLTALSDGNFVAAGYTLTKNKDTDGYLLKFDKNLNKISEKTYGSSNDEQFRSITSLKKSIYVAGFSYSFSNGEDKDIWILKLDLNCDM